MENYYIISTAEILCNDLSLKDESLLKLSSFFILNFRIMFKNINFIVERINSVHSSFLHINF